MTSSTMPPAPLAWHHVPVETPHRIGPFTLESTLGRGGMGVVYAARRDGDPREYALKLPHAGTSNDAAVRAEARREVQAMARLSHPHVLPVGAWGEADDRLWIAMPQIADGKPLTTALPRLGPADRLRLVDQLTDALGYIHDRGVLHRDIKPDNLLVGDGPHLWLTDFGIAELSAPLNLGTGGSSSGNHGPDNHEVGPIVGTPAFMAPEQVKGRSIGPEADLYAVGVLLFWLFAGRLPFEGESPLAVVVKQLRDPAPRLEGRVGQAIPEGLPDIVARLLAKDPLERYPSASALRAHLVRVHAGIGGAWSVDPELATVATQTLDPALTQATSLAVPPALLTARDDVDGLPTLVSAAPIPGDRSVTALALRLDPARRRFFATILRRCGAVVQRPASDLVVGIFGPPIGGELRRVVDLADALQRISPSRGLQAGGLTAGPATVDGAGVHGGAVNEAIALARAAPAGELRFAPSIRRPRQAPVEHRAGGERGAVADRLLRASADVTRDRRAQLLSVVGASGMGKSAALRRLAVDLTIASPPWTVLTESAVPGDDSAPLCVVREALAAWTGVPAGADAGLSAALVERALPAPEPALALDVAALLARGARPRLDSPTDRARDFAVVGALFDALTAHGPVLLVVDDLHHADPTTQALLRHLHARLADRPLLVVTAGHPGDDPPGEVVGVKRLDEASAWALLEDLSGREREHLGASAARLAAAWSADVAAGSDLAEMVDDRLARLPSDDLEVLRRAAALGPRFWTEQLAAVTRRVEDVEARLGALDAGCWITEARSSLPGVPAWRFEHELVRRRAEAQLDADQRARVAARSARWLETHADFLGATALKRLGEQWAAGGDSARAAAWLQRAGRRAEAEGALDAAGTAYAAAIERVDALPTGPDVVLPVDRPALLMAAARVANEVGDHGRADLLAARVLALEEPPRVLVQAEAHRILAEVQWIYGRSERALSELGRALATVGAGGDPVMRALLLGRRGWLLGYNLGRHLEGRRDVERAVALVADLDLPDVSGQLYSYLGAIHLRAGDWPAQLKCNRQALALAERAGDLMGQVRALVNLGVCCYNRGALDEAAARTEAAAELAARVGADARRMVAVNNLGGVRLDQGRLAEAVDLLDRCISAAHESGTRDILYETYALRARAALRAGDASAAERFATMGAEESERIGTPTGQAHALRVRALARDTLGNTGGVVADLSLAAALGADGDIYELLQTRLTAALVEGHPAVELLDALVAIGADADLERRRWSPEISAGGPRSPTVETPTG